VLLVSSGRVDRLPFFLAREAPVELEHRVDTPPGEASTARPSRRSCSRRSPRRRKGDEANLDLLEANARLAAEVAFAFAGSCVTRPPIRGMMG
jgi:pseudouridine-5'-phosphate glycosidase